MPDRNARRRDDLARVVREQGVDALLVTSTTNVTYLTGFTGDASALLLAAADGRALVVSDGRYDDQLARECPDCERHIRPIGQPLIAGVAEVAGRLGPRALALEASAISKADFDDLAETYDGALKPVRGLVEGLRMIKDDGEVALIREAIDVAERAFERLRAGLRPEDSEKDVADRLEADLRRLGAAGSSFPPIVAAGANSALPHYRGSAATRLEGAGFVLVDWGASGAPLPYKSDLTRVLATGKVTPKFEEVYRLVLAAQARGIAAIRPGATGRQVDAEARSAIAEAGFGDCFRHGLGHGLGLDIHEAPMLRAESATELRPGMVVTVEPGVYLPGWGGIRIEDDVLVTPDGAEVLTRTPRSLDEVPVIARA
ncbi:MAG TPA: Xaa-Pro peptidase family protein [Isosphaeraceae bacterium]|jgi:Xaa-Pro aminopeptidase|nr:Xaa-Pro peptidase family protein [Isosphaeraceae bacterium]